MVSKGGKMMTLTKYVEIGCDNCNCAIDFYNGGTFFRANEYLKSIGGIVFRELHFCNEKCKKEYLEKRENSLLQNRGEKHNKDVVNIKKYNNKKTDV